MTWFKVDDKLAFHPKVLTAGNAAMGLWVKAGSWSSSQLTDGYIPTTMLPILGAKKADAERLVTVGLWIKLDDGYQFHQWTEHNPARSTVEESRANKERAAALGNHTRWHEGRGVTDLNCPHCRDKKASNK